MAFERGQHVLAINVCDASMSFGGEVILSDNEDVIVRLDDGYTLACFDPETGLSQSGEYFIQ